MLNHDRKKIKSVLKFRTVTFAAGIIGAGVVIGVLAAVYSKSSEPTTTLSVSNHTLTLSVATTSAEQEKGLGDRASMPMNQGMLFINRTPYKACLWMKGMHFSLDMAWLDTSKSVIYTSQHVTPATYPTTYCPPSAAKYMIELDAGQLNKLNIYTGQVLKF